MTSSDRYIAPMVSEYLHRDDAIVDMVTGRVLHLGLGVSIRGIDEPVRAEWVKDTLHGRLSERNLTVGVEINGDVVDIYNEILGNAVSGDVERLADSDLEGPFDFVVAADIIEHLSNPGMMLDGIRALASPRTKLILTTPHAFGLPGFIRYTLGRFHEAPDHVFTCNIQSLTHLLLRHGWEVEYVATCHQRSGGGVLRKFGEAVLSMVPRFGGTIFMVSRPHMESAG